ncbi:MAG: hypothetical protein JXN60_09000 [Lentisphaerae bacterium]|nr:hypothetical protein [Lentisphaerota bacterium]
MEITAFLGISDTFAVRWKPAVKKLSGDLVVACDVNTIATAGVGALKVDNVFTYRVVQGGLKEVKLELPKDLNVTQVRGLDIQDWTIDQQKNEQRNLVVTLSRSQDKDYMLGVESEMVLPQFPCKLELPVIAPLGTIRSSGFLMLGTDSAIKLFIDKALGLTQINQTAFPMVKFPVVGVSERQKPSGSLFAYQYANMPYVLNLSADDIVPEYSSDERLELSVEDNNLVLNASVELDIRDAPAREIDIRTDTGWTVANVFGAVLSDYDVRDEFPGKGKGAGKRTIRAHFRDATEGKVLINVRLEQSMTEKQCLFVVPEFTVAGAKSERGYIILAAEQGMRLEGTEKAGLREVQTGSVESRIPGAQLAYRYKEQGWALSFKLVRTLPTVYAEVFHLVSIGEGVLYCSGVITYRIEGAPIRSFRIHLPKAFQNVEFIGHDVRGWEQSGEIWTVSLQEKVIGDYTLGVTYDKPFVFEDAEILAGELTAKDVASESGYIVLASSASLKLLTLEADESIYAFKDEEISREVPKAYALFVNDPILKAYKYSKTPHTAKVKVTQYCTEPLLNQIADHTYLSTEISKDGEAITTVTYAVKNLFRQYLEIVLPEDARLWSTKCSGNKENLVSLSDGKKTLIPINRLQNPNMPVTVEVQYAQRLKSLGRLGRQLKFIAPLSDNMHSTFTEWRFAVPREFAISDIDGNMTLSSIPWTRGLTNTIYRIGSICVTVLARYGGLVAFFLVIVIGAATLARGLGSGRGAWWCVGICVLTLIVAVAAGIVVQSLCAVSGLHRITRAIESNHAIVRNVISVTRTVSIGGTEPAMVVLDIAPRWLGNGSLSLAILASVFGLWILRRSCRNGVDSGIRMALGMALITVGVAEIPVGKIVLVIAFTVALPILVVLWVIKRAYVSGREIWQPVTVDTAEPPPFEWDAEVPAQSLNGTESQDGRTTLPLLLLLAAMSGVCVAVFGASEKHVANVNIPTMKSVIIEAVAPAMDSDRDQEKSARVSARYEFEVNAPCSFPILNAPAVLTEHDMGSRHLTIQTSDRGYLLTVEKKGTYEVTLGYSVHVVEDSGAWFMGVEIPANLRNKLTLQIPGKDLDVESPDAVFMDVAEDKDSSTVTAIYGLSSRAHISWRARARKTKLEKTVCFCEVNTIAVFEPGVVDLTNLIRFQIAQGEIKAVSMAVPRGMSVTALDSPGLSTWRFDPETRMLEAVLEKPASGDFTMRVAGQIACEGLPYDTVIGALEVKDASRQRGSIAFAVPGMVQIQVGKTDGLSAMNIKDVSLDAITLSRESSRIRGIPSIKRAFRYHNLPISASVHAERVLPEIRMVETSGLSISDERIVLATKLEAMVSKAGIFSLRLDVPEGFDVETLTGSDVSHWDEPDGVSKGTKGVVVHFKRQVIGQSVLNLVIARMEKGIEQIIVVPRVTAENVFKHTGKLVVSGERGVRMTTVDRQGVSETNPRDEGIRSAGALAFRLLRPDWEIKLKAEVVEPTIRAEVLHRVDISESVMHGTAYVRYRIENAGCKTFRLKAPVPETRLNVTGDDIAKVSLADKALGIWEVELHSKREDVYSLQASYQTYIGKEKTAKVLPLSTANVDSQKGYLVIMAGGRVQVRSVGAQVGLKSEDARSVPAYFGVDDLADAIQCYRTISGDYDLELSVVRPDPAEVLPAKVNDVRMVSVMSENGHVLTRVVMDITVGTLPVLEMTLPGDENLLWSAFVKGKAATVRKEDNKYGIQLDEPVLGETTTVEFVYAMPLKKGWFSRQTYMGPQFGLPLQNIEWIFYVVPGRHYHGFSGTMNYEKGVTLIKAFDREHYAFNNLRQIDEDTEKAKTILAQGEQLAREGKQYSAKKALESAINYSRNDAAFNEDARIQYKNLAEQQAVVGLAQRRDKMRYDRNIQDQGQAKRLQEFKGGNFTAEYAADVQKSLSTGDNESMRRLAGKILDQQEAAQRVAQAIAITMPLHGRELRFARSLQIEPASDMIVSFKVSSGTGWRWMLMVVTALALAGLYWWLIKRVGQSRKNAAA